MRMGRRGFLVICAVALAAAPLFSAGSSVAAETPRIEATPSKEAWHNITPPCMALVDCSLLPTPSPFPGDTLHVAVSGGEESARTYLAFAPALPLGAVLTEGTLTLPLDTDPSHGSINPEQANFVACMTDPTFEEAQGSMDQPPEVDCKTRRSALYSEKRMVFEVDLGRFLEEWTATDFALALVPSDRALEGTETWRVVFPASPDASEDPPEDDTDEPPPPITATLRYSVEAAADPIGTDLEFDTPSDTGTTSTGSSSSDFSSSSDLSFEGSTDTATLDSGSDLSDVAAPSDALESADTQPAASFAAGFAGPGFAYPIVWALPLLILALFFAVGRALTKELYRAGE